MRRAAMAMALALGATATADELVRAPVERWCVTLGRVDGDGGRARVDAGKMRAVVPASDGNAAELRFVYRGPSREAAPLASGELRRQIGIKLRAEDGCNLLYVMWRIEPKSRLVVSIKRNPGARTHRECGVRGYRNLTTGDGVALPPLVAGEEHALRAEIVGATLRVMVDGETAWQARLDDEAQALRGAAGVRSDNGRFDVELRVRGGTSLACARDED